MLKYFFVIFFVSSLFMFSCQNVTDSYKGARDIDKLTERVWLLDKVTNPEGKLYATPDTAWTYWIQFKEDSEIAAQDACNQCGGSFTVNDETLDIELYCTEIACSDPIPKIAYGLLLGNARTFTIKSETLYIHTANHDDENQVLVHSVKP